MAETKTGWWFEESVMKTWDHPHGHWGFRKIVRDEVGKG